jgi:hypothetical protein
LLAGAVRIATAVAVALVVAGIVIHRLDGHTSKAIMSAVNDAAKWLVRPFHNAFHAGRKAAGGPAADDLATRE